MLLTVYISIMEFKKLKDDLLFVPLGGGEEIGMNLNLYHFNGKWIIVDLGIGFADEYYPGVEILVPNINFIQKIKKDLLGIVLTHAHEDHIGAIQYLWHEIGCPIYTTKFTANVLRAKLAETGIDNLVKIHEIKENTNFKVGPFSIEMIGLTHSVPEMSGLFIRTDNGNVFHTGDWKFDPDPVVGEVTKFDLLNKIAKEGVLAMVGDSTNIFREGRSGSEGALKESLTNLIAGRKKGMIVITTFASNIGRLKSIMMAAHSAKRRVTFVGRSLWRMYEAAIEAGYLEDVAPPIKPKEAKKFRREELLVVATGCQGEPRAATNKFAKDEHPDIKLNKTDLVIFSSKIIPGNEKRIFHLFNAFCRKGIDVLTEEDHFVHVSGHPSRDEVKEMYEIIKPTIAIPIHGEAVHTHEHCAFAKNLGVKHTIQVKNGSVIKISQEGPENIGEVETGHMAVDGNFIIDSDSDILRTRRKMRDNGLIIATIILSKKGDLITAPSILAPGVLDSHEDKEYFATIVEELKEYLEKNPKIKESERENKIRNIIRRIISVELGKEPKIITQIYIL
jgi:ribonuclease J